MSKPTVLEVLRATYSAINIPAVSAGLEIGLAEKTTRNMLSEGRFPVKTKKISNRRVVSIFDLAAFLEGDAAEVERPAEKRRGHAQKKHVLKQSRQNEVQHEHLFL